MKKRWHYRLAFIFLFVIFSVATGCFGGLDDPQKTVAAYINLLYAKSDTPSAEERYQKLISTVSTSADMDLSKHRDEIMKLIQQGMIKGFHKPYYIANNVNDPQTDTRRSIIIRIPKGSITMDEFNTKNDVYVNLIVTKEGDEWKILNAKDFEGDTAQASIKWKEVDPTDYLD